MAVETGRVRTTPRFAAAGVAALVGLATLVPLGAVAAAGAFSGMEGAWAGGGTVVLASGTRERLRCRAQYLVQNDDNNLQQALRCASDSYKFELNSYIDHKDGVISGSWNELTNEVSGKITGSYNAGRIEASVDGTGFSAVIAVITRGNEQSVSIVPKETDVREVSITLRRR